MGTKTISLADDAYMRLKRLKRGHESFSDVVRRLTGREDISRFAGSISEAYGRELADHARTFRDRFERDARRR